MYSRKLTQDDWSEMARLRFKHHTHAGESIKAFTAKPITFISNKYLTDPHFAIGSFINDQLVSYICANVEDDYWVLDLMISNFDPTTLQYCLNSCIQEMENRGIFKFYYAFPKKWARSYKSFWKDGSELLKKYVVTDIGEVESDKIPKDKWIWENIIYKVIVPAKLLIRCSDATKSSRN